MVPLIFILFIMNICLGFLRIDAANLKPDFSEQPMRLASTRSVDRHTASMSVLMLTDRFQRFELHLSKERRRFAVFSFSFQGDSFTHEMPQKEGIGMRRKP